jgi:hypothetical protein
LVSAASGIRPVSTSAAALAASCVHADSHTQKAHGA